MAAARRCALGQLRGSAALSRGGAAQVQSCLLKAFGRKLANKEP